MIGRLDPAAMLAHRLILSELDATIARADDRLARQRLSHKLRSLSGLDTIGSKALVRRTRARLDNLHQQRFLLLFRGVAGREGDG
jgi:hypothetical protein